MLIGNFLNSLEEGEVTYLVNDAIERIPDRRVRLSELNQDHRPYFNEDGSVRRNVDLNDDFLNLIIGVIADDTADEPTSADYLPQYEFETARGARVTNFLETFLAESASLASTQ